MTFRKLVFLAAAGSAALLLGALGFQYLGDLPPCKLCIWQRYPHAAAVVIGVAALATGLRVLALAGAAAALTTAGVGVYHAGVELRWWEGPDTCTSSGDIGGMAPGDLLDQILAAPVVRCDEALWEFMGLSMASWNAALSVVLAGLWLAAWRARA